MIRAWRATLLGVLMAACTTTATTAPATRSKIDLPAPIAPATGTSTTTSAPPRGALASTLDAVLLGTDSCLLVTDGTTGVPLYSRQADVALTPASTQKLFVAAAALERLGPDFRFSTAVVAPRPAVAGVVDALWLVGGGDPMLATPEYAAALETSRATLGYPTTPLASLADQLAASGIRIVRDSIHGDDSRYEKVRSLPTWAPTINHGEFDIGPLGALEVDQGLDHWRPAVATADPAGHSASALARLLGGRKVVAAQGVDQAAPSGVITLASVKSAPLSEIIKAMLRASDNQIAELLVRELDHHTGRLGTTAGGVREVMSDVAQLGLPAGGVSLVDGSGLSRGNQATCRALLEALDLGDQPRFSALADGLPIAGVSGTLSNLFAGTPLSGRLAAKGGYIAGVTALVGRVSGPHPRRFALVVNGKFSFPEGLGLSERVVEALAA